MPATCPRARETVRGKHHPSRKRTRRCGVFGRREDHNGKKEGSVIFFALLPWPRRSLAEEPAPESKGSDWMAHAAAAAARSRCVVAVLAVAVFLACLPPAASSSSRRAAAALQRVQMAAMYTPQDLQEKPDLTKDAEEDVSTTGLGEEEEREVPTGPDPIHHHGRGPRRQQSP
uniref:Uncharacterized protein n=1 Tax=Avena sativa TaxID=4498 RepID=A0ACD5UCL7_AVESA